MASVPDVVVQIKGDVATSALIRILAIANYDLVCEKLTSRERLVRIAEIVRETVQNMEVIDG